MYSPPMLNVWLPPQPDFRKLKEPLTCGRLMSRSSPPRAATDRVRADIRNARRRALGRDGSVGVITADAGFDVERVGHGGVVFAFPHAHGKIEARQRIARLERLARADGKEIRLLKPLALQVADEPMPGRQEVGGFAGDDLGVERGRRIEQPRVSLRHARGSVGTVPPRLVLFQVTAGVDREVAKGFQNSLQDAGAGVWSAAGLPYS